MATKKKTGKKTAAKKKGGKSGSKAKGSKGMRKMRMGTPITVGGDG